MGTASNAGDATAGPTRRVVLLGASNLTRGLGTVIDLARSAWGGPLDVLVAEGHGRSYGADSSMLGRRLRGIDDCGLWEALRRRPSLPTAALLTDVGNDVLYGAPVATIVDWVRRCLDRLAEADARTTMTLLPLASVAALSPGRFWLFRTVLFPGRRMSLAEALGRAGEINERLAELGAFRGLDIVEPRACWYGFDPIHPSWRHRRAAWNEILSGWRGIDQRATAHGASSCDGPPPPFSPRRWMAYRLRAPEQRWLLGLERHRAQPALREADGTTVSLY